MSTKVSPLALVNEPRTNIKGETPIWSNVIENAVIYREEKKQLSKQWIAIFRLKNISGYKQKES